MAWQNEPDQAFDRPGGRVAEIAVCCESVTNPPDTRELWSLIRRLPREERLRLAKMVFRSAAEDGDDTVAYADAPVGPDEFSSEDEPLSWDAEGWDEFSAAR
jgi:hypothetical protein